MLKWCVAAVTGVVAFFLFTQTGMAGSESFQSFLQEYPAPKVFVELKNSSGDDKVDLKLLKKMIEDALTARKSNKFVVVSSAGDADLIFKGDVTEYVWMAEDPVDEVYGVASAALDAAMIENYARMHVQTDLVAAKNNRILWSDRVKATMTRKDMPREKSYELIYPKFIKSVTIEIFKKRKNDSM